MKNKYQHLVFYDGKCGLCDHVVQTLLKFDHEERFVFAPLQGITAGQFIKQLPADLKNIDSIILIENFKSEKSQIFVFSKAVFRICWLLGGFWIVFGWLNFLPSGLFDWAYRLVAKNRQKLFAQDRCFVPPKNSKDRFLP